MSTQQTLRALDSLLAQALLVRYLVGNSKDTEREQNLSLLLSVGTRDKLKQTTQAVYSELVGYLIDGLKNAKTEFIDTPFNQSLDEVIAGFLDGSSSSEEKATVTLSKLLRETKDWLMLLASRDCLMAKINAANNDLLRDFSNSVLEEEEEEE